MFTVRGHTSPMVGNFWFIIVDEHDSMVVGTHYYSDKEDAERDAKKMTEIEKIREAWGTIVNYLEGEDDLSDAECEAMDALHEHFAGMGVNGDH